MTPTCMDDYAIDTTQFRSVIDPYPASSASLPTSLAGELERVRYVIKAMTGWSQWYAHTESVGSSPFVKKTGDTMTGSLRQDASIGMGVTPASAALTITWSATGDNGPSIYGGGGTQLTFRGGTAGTQWNNQVNAFANMSLLDSGTLTLGAAGTVRAGSMLRFAETVTTAETFLPRIHQGSVSGTGSDLHIGSTSTSGAIKFYTGAVAAQTDLLGTSANAVRVTISSAGSMTVHTGDIFAATGTIGIGLTSGTSDRLHIKSSASVNLGIRIENTASGGRIWRLISAATGSSVGAGAFGVLDETGGTSPLVISSTGILTQLQSYQAYTSTYTPQAQFGTVTAASTGNIQIVGNVTSGLACGAIEFINHANGLLAEPRLAVIQALRAGANNTGQLEFFTAAAGSIGSADMILTNGGRLLLGTTVEVGADAKSLVLSRGADGGGLRIVNNANNDTIRVVDTSTDDVIHVSGSGNNVKFVADTILMGTGVLAVGTNAASAGTLRLPNTGNIGFRNAANSADHNGLNLNSSDQIVLGSTSKSVIPDADASQAFGISSKRWDSGYFAAFVAVGTNPAASGSFRIANSSGGVTARNAANSGDIQLLTLDGSNRVTVGPADATNVRMGGQVRVDLDTASRLVLPVGADKWAV